MRRTTWLILAAALLAPNTVLAQRTEYRVLATNKTSTMEKELNDAAEQGFRFQAVMGKPARARFAAIAAPIVPRPRNATLSIAAMVRVVSRTGPARAPDVCPVRLLRPVSPTIS